VGGLGNQLFQVAAALAYGRRTGRALKLPRRVAEGGRRRTYHRDLFTALPRLGLREALLPRARARQEGFAYTPLPELAARRLELCGFFQSARYFEQADVAAVLRPSAAIAARAHAELAALRKEAQGAPLLAVHVRRGDYLHKREIHPPLSDEYYRRALACFPPPHLVALFSDDFSYCESVPVHRAQRTRFVRETEQVSLLVMAGCDHHVIANSSFSWWGAYLGARPGQRVLAPARWFGPRGPRDTQDLLPAHWERLACS
jgi:hypothetical protein